MGKNLECATRGLEALDLFGMDLPPLLNNPDNALLLESQLLEEIAESTKALGMTKSFAALPVLQDAFLLALHSVLLEMTASLAWAATYLLHTIPLVGVSLTFKHGKCVHSVFHVLSLTTPNR